jgi:hypothetical protein
VPLRHTIRNLREEHQFRAQVLARGIQIDLCAMTTVMTSAPAVTQDHMHGYTVAYEREEIQFPVYVVGFIGACFATAGYALDNIFLIALALLAFGFAYYNFPLLETGKPRLGAGQYGIFADGLGIVSWRAIKRLDLVPVEVRGSSSNELRVILHEPLDRALLADWRKRPFYRFLMRLPWTMAGNDVIRIPLDVFDRPAAEIHHTFTRMMTFYRY